MQVSVPAYPGGWAAPACGDEGAGAVAGGFAVDGGCVAAGVCGWRNAGDRLPGDATASCVALTIRVAATPAKSAPATRRSNGDRFTSGSVVRTSLVARPGRLEVHIVALPASTFGARARKR